MAPLIAYTRIVLVPFHVIEHLSNEFNNHFLIAVVGCGDGSCEPDSSENMNGNPIGFEISFDAYKIPRMFLEGHRNTYNKRDTFIVPVRTTEKFNLIHFNSVL